MADVHASDAMREEVTKVWESIDWRMTNARSVPSAQES